MSRPLGSHNVHQFARHRQDKDTLEAVAIRELTAQVHELKIQTQELRVAMLVIENVAKDKGITVEKLYQMFAKKVSK